MIGPTDVVLVRRRRRFLLVNFLIAGSYAAGGVVIGTFTGDRLGYVIAVFFGVCTVYWAGRLLAPPEVLLASPATRFVWIAPEYERARPQLAGMQPPAKTTSPIPEPAAWSGIWDEELDGAPQRLAGR